MVTDLPKYKNNQEVENSVFLFFSLSQKYRIRMLYCVTMATDQDLTTIVENKGNINLYLMITPDEK